MYHVHLVQSVNDYLETIPGDVISPDNIIALIEEFTEDLGERADHLHELFPCEHESLRFTYETLLIDSERLYEFRLIVDMSHAEYGVVSVIYIDRNRLHPPS